MKEGIRQRARELGFEACRFTSAAPPETGRHFRRWLEAQRHGEMSYLERNAEKRVDPQRVLAGARSILCLAASYHRENAAPAPASHGEPQPHSSHLSQLASARLAPPQDRTPTPPAAESAVPSTGLIARYARFADYHDVLGEGLKALAAFVGEIGGPSVRSLWYVDTGPFLERDLAQRAGLGFIGKHTNLISRDLGNWFFLAEIITTLEIEPDGAERNRCGTCTRCIAACPTEAIVAPFQLDARRCISYLTIELKGPIPVELRPALGVRIYGCDDCLAVCPWNRFAREGRLMREHAREDLNVPGLLELLALDEAGFKCRFDGTPILRAKRRGLLRNVCVALGNIGDARVLPALETAACEPEPLIAEHARWAIAQIEARGGVRGGGNSKETPAAHA